MLSEFGAFSAKRLYAIDRHGFPPTYFWGGFCDENATLLLREANAKKRHLEARDAADLSMGYDDWYIYGIRKGIGTSN